MTGDPAHRQDFDLHVTGVGYETYKFRREIEKRLAYVPQIVPDKIRLDLAVSASDGSATVARDSTTSRMQTRLSVLYIIKRGDKKLAENNIESVTAYPVNAVDEFVTKTSSIAAGNRTATSAAEDLVREIVMVLSKPE